MARPLDPVHGRARGRDPVPAAETPGRSGDAAPAGGDPGPAHDSGPGGAREQGVAALLRAPSRPGGPGAGEADCAEQRHEPGARSGSRRRRRAPAVGGGGDDPGGEARSREERAAAARGLAAAVDRARGAQGRGIPGRIAEAGRQVARARAGRGDSSRHVRELGHRSTRDASSRRRRPAPGRREPQHRRVGVRALAPALRHAVEGTMVCPRPRTSWASSARGAGP